VCVLRMSFLSIRLIVLRVSLGFWTSGFAPCSAEWPRFVETCDLGQESNYSERVADPAK
jgi:hypothetical protein